MGTKKENRVTMPYFLLGLLYTRYGFVSLQDCQLEMFLSLGSIKSLLDRST